MKQGAWKCFPLQIRAKKGIRAAGGGEREGTSESGGPMVVAMDREGNKSACVSPPPSIYCWRHVSERLGDSGPNNSSSHPETCPLSPPQSHVSPHGNGTECPRSALNTHYCRLHCCCPTLQWLLQGQESWSQKQTLTMMTRRIFWKSFLWPRV